MKNIIKLCAFLTVGFINAQQISSNFTTNAEDWMVVGDATSAFPLYVAQGGNTGGYVSADDTAAGGVWYWSAPAKFLGDQSSSFGKTLSFDLKQSSINSQFDTDDIIISNGQITITYDHAYNPGLDWTSYSVVLDTINAWKIDDITSGELATSEQIMTVLSNILSLAIRQEDNTSQHIREQLNIGDTLLTDLQLQVFSRHLYGPDHDTIHTISELLSTEMAQLRIDIEYNYQTMSPEKTQELQAKIKDIANIFHVLNLTEVHTSLIAQAQELNNIDVLKDEHFAQKLMNELLAAMNAIGILERHHTSNRLQLRVNNRNIALDRLDDAHATLLNEAKLTIDLITFTLEQHLKDQDLASLANIPAKLEEVAGALLFLNVVTGQTALKNSANFVAGQIEAEKPLSTAQVHGVFDTLASADMLIENLKNKQPVLQSMFDVALVSSEKLKSVA